MIKVAMASECIRLYLHRTKKRVDLDLERRGKDGDDDTADGRRVFPSNDDAIIM